MTKVSLALTTGSTGETDCSSENERTCSCIQINQLASFVMANSSKKALHVERKNGHQIKITGIIQNGKKVNGVRSGKSLYESNTLRNGTTQYKPTYVDNSIFVKNRTMSKIAGRRKSLPGSSTAVLCSTMVFDLSSQTVIYDENKSSGSFKNKKQNFCEKDEIFPFLTSTSEIGSAQSDTVSARTSTAKERRRHSSGQNRVANSNTDALPTRRKSVDYSSMASITPRDTRSAALASSRYSQPGIKNAFVAEPLSAWASTSAGRRKSTSSLQRPPKIPPSTSDVNDAVSKSNSDLSNIVEIGPRKLNFRSSQRSNSVYSPSSVASTEKLARFKQKVGFRRASMPNPTLIYQADLSSPEYHKTMHELKLASSSPAEKVKKEFTQPTAINCPPSSISSSLKDPQAREVLQKIEEISPEETSPSFPGGNVDANVKGGAGSTGGSNLVDSNQGTDGENDNPHCVGQFAETKLNAFSDSIEVVVSPPFHIPDKSGGEPQKIPSKVENEKAFSFKEDDLDEDADHHGSSETNEEFKLLCVESEGDSDFIDDSVIFKDNEDLCDDDLHEKRMILWIKSVATGDEAEQTTRITPPPSPDPNTMESAIRVVYDGGN